MSVHTQSCQPLVKTLPLPQALAELRLPGIEDNLFSSPDWMLVAYKTYGLKLFVKYIEEDGQIISYIFYSVVKNFLEWKICVCSFCDYCDGHVRSREHWQLFVDDLKRRYPKYRIAIRNLRDDNVRHIPQLEELSREKCHTLILDDDIDTLWKNASNNFKGAVKKAEKSGVTVRRCDYPALKDFYRLHLRLRRHKHKVFPQPFRFFDVIWQQYMAQGKGVLIGAYDPQGRMIASNIYLICGDTLYYKFNTSALDALYFNPNNIVMWEGIRFAKERGLRCMDMGSSGCEQKGLIFYKTHILKTFEERDIIHLGYAPPGYKFSQKIILKTYTRLFTQPFMPDPLVAWGSNLIYPYLA